MSKTKNLVTLMIMLLCCTAGLLAQVRSISGRIVDQHGQPASFATVRVKGTPKGVSADADGAFTIKAQQGQALIVTGTGITQQEFTIGDGDKLDLSIARKESSLTEVVVVGYGVQRRSDINGNIASVKGSAIAEAPVQSFESALAGRASGVQITSANGVLNNPPVFRIRGTNSVSLSSYPLIVIDGVPTFTGDIRSNSEAANNPLASINPDDIESMDILKDAAATAIYGSRAANGVVIITTKKGKRGKPVVSYEGWVGETKATRLWKMLDATQYMTIKNEAVANKGSSQKFLPANGPDGKPINTNWKGLVYRTGISHSHSLNVSGGNESTTYFVSAGYTDQNGIIVKNSFARKTVRFNLDHKVSNILSLGVTSSYSDEINASTATSGSLPGQAYNTAGLGRAALILPPNLGPYNADGTLNIKGSAIGTMNDVGVGISYPNIKVLIDNDHSTAENNHIQANAYVQLKPVQDVILRSTYGIDNLNSDNDLFQNPIQGDGYPGGEAIATLLKYKRWVWTTTGQYDHVFADKHTLGVLAGTEQQATNIVGFGLDRTNLSDPFFTNTEGGFTDNVPATVNNNINGLRTQNYLVSAFGRLNYDYDKRYFIGGSTRRDGYSAFAHGHKYGNFWSASGAWDISREKFWSKWAVGRALSTFRLRGSYGTVGNTSGIGDFASFSFYASDLYNANPAIYFSQSGNPNLTWETSKKTDIGLQFGVLNDMISGEVAWYRNNVDHLIIDVPQSGSTGIPDLKIPTNVGSMYNRGWEITLDAKPVSGAHFKWTTSLNASINSNKVLALAPGVPNIIYSTGTVEAASITLPGYSVGTFYVLPTAGVDPQTGRRVFINSAGDHVLYDFAKNSYTYQKGGADAPAVTAADKRPMFNSVPKYFGGFNNTFRSGNFDANVLISYEGGFYVYNGTQASIRDQRFWNNSVDILRRWQKPGDITDIPRVVYGDNISNGSANPISENVQKGDFIKLRNVSLGYNFTAGPLSKAGISRARLYVSGSNLVIITCYKGPDPEVSTNGNDNLGQGVDRNSVANGRTFTIGLSLHF